MEGNGYYHLGAQCKDCTLVEDDKWEWSTGEPLPLRFGKWGSTTSGRKYPYDDSGEDAIYLLAYKLSGGTAYFVNYSGSKYAHAICQKKLCCNKFHSRSAGDLTYKDHFIVCSTVCISGGMADLF